MISVFYPLANLIISSLVFIETCISKIDFKTFYANTIVMPWDRRVNGVCCARSHLTAPATWRKNVKCLSLNQIQKKNKSFYIIFNNDLKNSIKFAVFFFFCNFDLKTLCRCSSLNEVVNVAASPDGELLAVDSQGAEIVTAGVWFWLKKFAHG